MLNINELITNGYPWLSFMGGVHCLALAGFVRFTKQESYKLLSVIFCVLSLYFFAGLLLNQNHLLSANYQLILIAPVYLCLTPLVYLYCQQNLLLKQAQFHDYKHFIPVVLVPLTLFFMTQNDSFSLGFGLRLYFAHSQLSEYKILISATLPVLLSIQAAFYFLMLLKLLNHHRHYNHYSVENMQFRWILLITLSLLLNWLIRVAISLVSAKLDTNFSEKAQVLAQISLLATIYIVAIYWVKQVTISAYSKSVLAQQTTSPYIANNTVLDADELSYLQEVLGMSRS